MAKFDLKEYARRGAEARVSELKEELDAIYAAFPELRAGGRRQRAQAQPESPSPSEGTRRSRKRRKMSAAQRKAAGERLKKYWAERKKGNVPSSGENSLAPSVS